jgi:crotonobetainyl-CoA:carnitine CoA-transferase CaiB-like acyl-CoA transferase
VAPVLAPGEFWDHDQVVQCGLLSDADGFTMSGAPVHVDRILNVSGTPTLEFLDPTRSRPLAGLRFLDLGAYVAGPFASRLLGDLGAEVIKIEPRQGDPLRGIPRTFILTNAGKKSVIADLKTDQGRQQIHTLVRGADVVHHNYRAGVAERLGVGPQDLRAINPDIITVTTSAFGPSGPMAADPGFDMVIQALTGIEVRAGGNGNTPLWCRMPFVDFVSGALAAAGTLMALYERRNRGTASDISTSLLDAGMFMMSDLVRLQDGTFVMSRELDHQQLGTHPAERIYRATDGWLAVAVRSNHMAAELLEELGLAGEHDSNYPSWGQHVNEALAKRISQRECDELATALQRRDVWAQRCIQDGWAVLQRSEPAQRAGLVVVRTHRRYGEVAGIIGGFVEFSRVGTETAALGAVPELGQSAAWSTRPVVRSMTDVGQQRRTEREVEECQT